MSFVAIAEIDVRAARGGIKPDVMPPVEDALQCRLLPGLLDPGVGVVGKPVDICVERGDKRLSIRRDDGYRACRGTRECHRRYSFSTYHYLRHSIIYSLALIIRMIVGRALTTAVVSRPSFAMANALQSQDG